LARECPCGERLGVLQRQLSCDTCGTEICPKCGAWKMSEGYIDRSGRSSGIKEKLFCSRECAVDEAKRLMAGFAPSIPVELGNMDDIGVEVEQKPVVKKRSVVALWECACKPEDAGGEGMTPGAEAVYAELKAYLEECGIEYSEGFVKGM